MAETPAPAPAAPALSRLRDLAPRLAFSLLLALGFVYVFRKGGLPLLPSAEARAEIRWWCVPLASALLALSVFLRTYRWVYLLRAIGPVDAPRIFGLGLIGHGAVGLAPLRSGELVRPWLVSRSDGISFVQATGTVAAERIVDGLVVTAMLLFGLITAKRWARDAAHIA